MEVAVIELNFGPAKYLAVHQALACFHLHVPPAALQERAAREAAEHQRLQQQNEATRQAARRRALQTKQQQAQQLAEQLWQPTKRQNPLRSSFYMQRLRGRQHGQGESQAVPEWAKAARPLPPLLPLQPKQQQQGVVQPASSGNLVVDAGLTPSALEQQELVQQVQLGVGRQLTDEEQRLHAELDELDARMAQRGEEQGLVLWDGRGGLMNAG